MTKNEETKKVFNKYFACTPLEWWDNNEVDWVVKPTQENWEELYQCFDVSWLIAMSLNTAFFI
jgi:hypothetical protein